VTDHSGPDRDRVPVPVPVPEPFRDAGLAGLVRAVVPLPGPADRSAVPASGGRTDPDPDVPADEPALCARLSRALADGRLDVGAPGDDGWTGLVRSSHPPAFRVERRLDGAVRATAFRYPPRERSGGCLSRADACALAFVATETLLSPSVDAGDADRAPGSGPGVALVVSAGDALLAVDRAGLADARERYGDRLVVDGRRLLAAEPLPAAALAGYDPSLSLDHAETYGRPAPDDLVRVEAHPKGWALAHQPEVSRARARERDVPRCASRNGATGAGRDGS
jgi:hypothetical protein